MKHRKERKKRKPLESRKTQQIGDENTHMKHKKDKRDNFPIPVQWTSLTGMTRTKHVSASTNPLGAVNRYHIVTTGPCCN